MTFERTAMVSLDGRLLPAGEARISPLGEGFLYGAGVFETIKVIGGRPAFFAGHAARLRRGAAELGLRPADSDAGLRSRCMALIGANGLADGSLKIVVYEDAGSTGELLTAGTGGYPPEAFARGFKLRTVADGRRAGRVPGLKSLNYLRNLSAKREAQAIGFDEPLFIGEDGSALEGATTNVFCVKAGEVATPRLALGILPGIVRGVLLGLGSDPRIREGAVTLESLLTADEIFVTNSLLGVMPVCQLDSHRLDIGRAPVTRTIAGELRDRELQSLE
jgi:branched-subunit amino acid aminotransferase/4-amino-4-deoxychorismate lyase